MTKGKPAGADDDDAPAAPDPATPPRFVAASGARFDDDTAQRYGEELLRIAESNRVGDVRSLDKQLVFDAVAADPKSPLRAFVFDKDESAAARAHRIERCALLLRSIRVVTISVNQREEIRPMFIAAPAAFKERIDGRVPHVRSRVLSTDLATNIPLLDAALTSQITNITNATARLGHVIAHRSAVPDSVVALHADLREALAKYRRSKLSVVDAAAEE